MKTENEKLPKELENPIRFNPFDPGDSKQGAVESKHTPTPWKSEESHNVDEPFTILADSMNHVAFIHDNGSAGANAERIVACVNACEGINNEYLKNENLHDITLSQTSQIVMATILLEETEQGKEGEMIQRVIRYLKEDADGVLEPHWESNAEYPVGDWKAEVQADETRLSYPGWVKNQQSNA